MNRIKNSLIAFGGLSLLIGAIALVTPHPTQGQGGDSVGPTKPVLVVNTPSEPVPVTGSITGDVNVANTVRVSDAPRQIFNSLVQVVLPDGSQAATEELVTVPPGKQLVVTYASAAIDLPNLPTEQKVVLLRIEADSTSPTKGFAHQLVPVATGSFLFALSHTAASEPLHMYLNPGTVLDFTIIRNSVVGIGQAQVSVSGYFVDAP
ncbi:MAG: hypothetical protein M3410_17755 [Acidobacteriota bacterium]|nr:hypothetical protein [Acidobacteriota bacterium]